MELYVLNKNFITVGIIDEYESFNWTDRYNEAGDFELVLLVTKELLNTIQSDYYLYFNKSEHLMIIEGLEIKTDSEKGDRLIVTGRSLESLLQRRILWFKIKFNLANGFQHAIDKMVNVSMADEVNIWGDEAATTNRRIPGFKVIREWNNTTLDALRMDAIEYWGENLYDIVVDLCKSRDPDVGFKVTWNHTNSDDTFNFKLYIGKDRSSGNSENNIPISFTPRLDNIFDTDYYESVQGYKTTVLIAGQYPKNNQSDGEVDDITTYAYRGRSLTTYTGLYRREVFCDARNVPYKDDNGNLYNKNTVVKPALIDEGKKTLNTLSNKKAKTFEGEVDYTTVYEYGIDYTIGDVVDVADIYGHEMKARIVEVTFSDDEEGFSINPTFEMFGEVMGGE